MGVKKKMLVVLCEDKARLRVSKTFFAGVMQIEAPEPAFYG